MRITVGSVVALDVAEVCEILGVSQQTCRRMIREQAFPAVTIRGKLWVAERNLERFLLAERPGGSISGNSKNRTTKQ